MIAMLMTMLSVLLLLIVITTTEAFLPLLPPNGVASTNTLALFAEYQSKIDSCNSILTKAATTKNEDPDLVFQALSDLEKLMREKCKAEPEASQQVLQNLNGSWRLVFSTFTYLCGDSCWCCVHNLDVSAYRGATYPIVPLVMVAEEGLFSHSGTRTLSHTHLSLLRRDHSNGYRQISRTTGG
jgi:hypothetical protein